VNSPDSPEVPEEARNVAAQRASSLRSMFPGTRHKAPTKPVPVAAPPPVAPPAVSPPALSPPDADPTIDLPDPQPVRPARRHRDRRPVLVAGVVAAAFLAGGLTAYGLGNHSSGGDTPRHADSRPVPSATFDPYGPAEQSTTASPSPSPSAPRPTHSTAPATATARSAPATVGGSPPNLSGPLDGTGEILGINGQCLDNNSSRTADGNPIQVWACDQTPAQVWTVTNGRYTVQGKCLTVLGGSTASGTGVVLWTCDGSAAQQWTASAADNSVRNPASGLCLTAWDGFSPVVISPCVGGPGQKWTR
jgi:ricin-type beta-trefoil lectin protein